jgi:hypothetical protein
MEISMPNKLLRWGMAAAVCLVAVLVAIGAAFAQTTAPAVPAVGVIEIHPVLQWLLGTASAVGTASLSVLALWVIKRLGLQQSALTQSIITGAIQRAGGVAYGALAAKSDQMADPTIKSAAIAQGVQYVLDGAPATATKLGLTPDRLAAMVSAELGRLLAVDPTVTAGASATVALPVPVPVAVVGDAAVPAPAPVPVSSVGLLVAACLLGLTACATPAQTTTLLTDAETAQVVAHAALQVYAARPGADAALVAQLDEADAAAGAAIEAAMASPADDSQAQAAAAAVAVLTTLMASAK